VVKTPSHRRPGERDPSTAAALWLQSVVDGDPSAASLLYAPDARAHVPDGSLAQSSRSRIERGEIVERWF
jgi:hypothetical protein